MATCTKNHDNEVRFRRHELPAFISKKCSYSPRVGRSSWKSITSITSVALLASLSSIIVPLSFQPRFCITRTGYVGLCQRTVLFLFLALTNSGKYPVTCKKRCNQFVSNFFTNRTSFILLSSIILRAHLTKLNLSRNLFRQLNITTNAALIISYISLHSVRYVQVCIIIRGLLVVAVIKYRY